MAVRFGFRAAEKEWQNEFLWRPLSSGEPKKMTLSSSEKKKERRMKDKGMKNKRALARSNATYAFFWSWHQRCLLEQEVDNLFDWESKEPPCSVRNEKLKRALCGCIQVDDFSNTPAIIWDLISQMFLRSALPRLTDWLTVTLFGICQGCCSWKSYLDFLPTESPWEVRKKNCPYFCQRNSSILSVSVLRRSQSLKAGEVGEAQIICRICS